MKRLPIVGVMGSGTEDYPELSGPLGHWLAQQPVHLLTGGGKGVMSAVSQAFSEEPNRKGLVIGVLPGERRGSIPRPKKGYPNPWVEVPIYTHLPLSGEQGGKPLSRNHINVLSSDVIVALPGGPGTASEVALAIKYRRRLVAFLNNRAEIPDLPPEVPVEGDLERIKQFVLQAIRNLSRSPQLGNAEELPGAGPR